MQLGTPDSRVSVLSGQAAFCRKEEVFIMLSCDSSPQSGVDYQMTLEDVMERKRCWAELLIGSLWWESNLPLFLSVHDRASNQQRGSVAKKHVQHINIVLGFALPKFVRFGSKPPFLQILSSLSAFGAQSNVRWPEPLQRDGCSQ